MQTILDGVPGQQVMVFDSHYGLEHETTVLLVEEPSGRTHICGLDRNNQIYLMERDKCGVNCLINSRGFGSIKNNEVTGWCFDRDGLKLFGEEGKEIKSSGYYAER